MFKSFITKNGYQWLNSLLIAVSAALLCKETFIVAGIKYNGYEVYAVAFFTTLYAYLNHGEKNFSVKQFDNFQKFSQTFGNPFFDSLVGFALLSLFFVHSLLSLFIICITAVAALLYFGIDLPGTKFKIRKNYFAKTILLALVWTIATVLLPLSFAGENLSDPAVLYIFSRRFFFIAALTIPFEIRDLHKDAAIGDKNFVNLIGINKSKILAVASLCIYLSLAIIQLKTGALTFQAAMAMTISFLISAILILIYCADKKNSTLILFCIDGMLMVQFFLIVVANVLFQ